MNRKALIIFDCDGTLVDTERVGNQVLVDMIAELGGRFSLEEAIKAFAGRRMSETLDLVEKHLMRPLPEGFLIDLRERMAEAFRRDLTPMDGVPELLEALADRDYRLCVASNGPLEKMEVSLGVTGLLPWFSGRIFSAFECGAFKPDPSLFLHAARQLDTPSDQCIVIEDSIFGVQAAVRAGMKVYGYVPAGRGFDLAPHGALVFHHMNELKDQLH